MRPAGRDTDELVEKNKSSGNLTAKIMSLNILFTSCNYYERRTGENLNQRRKTWDCADEEHIQGPFTQAAEQTRSLSQTQCITE